jgi:hypothetical protein
VCSSDLFTDAEQDLWNQHAQDATYLLIIDGEDHTDTLQSCHEESGYINPVDAPELDVEIKEKQAVVEPTNKWIACARENGMPTLEDVTAVADNWVTYPAAVIPLSFTVEELEALLDACPNFDTAQAERQLDPDFDWENDYVPEPSIKIEDVPGMAEPEEAAQVDLTHYNELYEVLSSQQMEFLESRGPVE